MLPTGAAVGIENVEVRKEDGHLEGGDYCVRASPWQEFEFIPGLVAWRRGAVLSKVLGQRFFCRECNRCRGSALPYQDGLY